LIALTCVALLSPSIFAQKPAEKPLSETDLLKQIESLTPSRPTTTAAKKDSPAAAAASLFETGVVDLSKPGAGGDKKDRTGDKKSKGPTEITALEATFDQKANLAVFIGDVVVVDPEFNVTCDKLTAHLKHDDKPKAGAAKPGTPAATPVAKTDDGTPKKKSGGLEKAVAESTSDRRVIITQDKIEADGTKTQSVGKANKATYDAVTGDVVLTGSPEVIQGINRVVAVDPGTVMTLNRDGRMRANGLTKSTIVDKGDSR
jgi:lipopolysaccharide export system protein LptA